MENFNPFSLKNKVILVTGASSGIGKSIAIECSKIGAKLILTGRNEERLVEVLASLLGEGHSFFSADLSIESEMDDLITKIPSLDGLVHCAGIQKRLPLKFINSESFETLMKVNLFVPALFMQKLSKKKKLNLDGSVVFVSSVASVYASLGSIMYMTSKGALDSFMKGLALELAPQKVRANSIRPAMIKSMSSVISEDEISKDLVNYPLGRYGTPEEVAYAAIYLLSDTTKWMTGSVLTLDGGLTLR